MVKMNKERKILILYMLFVFLSSFGLLSQFLSSFLTSLKFDLVTISSLYLTFQISKFVLEVPTGYVADKFSRKISAILGMCVLLITYFIFLGSSFHLFYIAFFLKGLAITLLSGSIESIYVESVNQNKLIKYNAIERLVFYAALALSAVFGGYIINIFSYKQIILIDIAMFIIVMVIICLFDENKKYHKSTKTDVSAKECFKYALDKKVLMYLFILDFGNAFSFVAVENLYPAYLGKIGIQIDLIGIFIALQLLISAILGLFIGKIRIYINDKVLLYLLPCLEVLIILPIYIFKIPIILIPALFTIQSIVFVLYAPIKYTVFQNNIPNKYRTTFISLSSQAIALGAVTFYAFSSIMGTIFSMSMIISCALIITFTLNIYCCINLKKLNAVKSLNN